MAKRTIQSCWKQYERLVNNYLDESKDQEAAYEKIKDLTEKANGENLAMTLYTLFVKPFLPLELKVEFTCDVTDGVPVWQTKHDGENARILINPISTVRFIKHCQSVKLPEKDEKVEESEEEFLHSRYLSFLVEMGKLPSIYLLFMLCLQRTAYLLEIAHLEKRGGIIEVAEGEAYHTLLWAFKEFESFAQRTWGVQLRSQFGISWYESEWITGR